MKNCWFKRSPLETAFLLILIVSVPFLIIIASVYIFLLTSKCPGCSLRCSKYCNEKAASSSKVFPMLAQLNPNISLSKLHEKYRVCPDSMLRNIKDKVDHKFVAAVLEDVYIDDVKEQKYLCTAAIITFKWVVSSGSCIQNESRNYHNVIGVFVRAGSNFWSKDGSIHRVNQILFSEESKMLLPLAAIELKTEFPKFPTIRPIMLSRKTLYTNYGIAEMFGWKSNESSPLQFRKKYVKLTSNSMIIFKDARCERESKQLPGVFCAMNVKPTQEKCVHYTGFPLIRARVLIGVDVGRYCDHKQNVTVYLIYDFNRALEWIVKVTGVYVEHF